MVLCTLKKSEERFALERLQHQQIDYATQSLKNEHINLFFGKKECIEVVRHIIDKPLNQLTPEEDFILGVMLGYDICRQCKRYQNRKTIFKTA